METDPIEEILGEETLAGARMRTGGGTRERQAVCVIEDDAVIRTVLRNLLEDEGYRVFEAADGRVGLTLLQSHPEPLVVLLDYKLPKLDGCALLHLVAQDATLRTRHAFILVTASPAEVMEACGATIEDVAATVLDKPFSIDEMLDTVANAAWRLKQLEREG